MKHIKKAPPAGPLGGHALLQLGGGKLRDTWVRKNDWGPNWPDQREIGSCVCPPEKRHLLEDSPRKQRARAQEYCKARGIEWPPDWWTGEAW